MPNMDPQILGPVCTTPSPPNCIGLQSPRPQGLRPRGLCLRNSLSVLHRQRTRRHSPGAPRVPRSLTHLPSALQRAMSCPAAPPPPALPHPIASLPNPPLHQTNTKCKTHTLHRCKHLLGLPFPVRPRPAKRHVSPVRKCAGRVGRPRVGYRGRVPKVPLVAPRHPGVLALLLRLSLRRRRVQIFPSAFPD